MPELSEPLSCQRSLFSIPADHCYLNSAYMGPLPIATQHAGREAIDIRAFPARISAADFFDPPDRVRAMCAQLVNANPENVAFISTASNGLAIVAANLDPRTGQNVVLLGEQFPSNVYPWRNWRSRGVQLRTVDAPDAPLAPAAGQRSRAAIWTDDVLAAIDVDTALVAIEQAHWTDGSLFDLVRIGARCREVGAAFVIDGTQTVGAMPLDVQAVRPDALVVHAYKSMLSNYGLGFAVFGERFAGGQPVEESWMLRAGAQDFARLVDYQDAYAPGMRRYDTSTRSSTVLIRMLEASCRLLLEWRPARVRQYLLGIERGFVERVRGLGFGVADEADRAANVFGIELPAKLAAAMSAEQVRAALAERRIHVAVRGSAVRVAPHVYNDEADLGKLADALDELIGAVRSR